MIYLVLWAFTLLMLWALVRYPRHGKAWCLAALLAMGVLAVLRAQVGTDTASYEDLSALVRQGGALSVKVEPLFALLLQAYQWLGLDDAWTVRLVSALQLALLVVFVWRSTPDERYFLLAVFLPAFFFTYAMNALRIGLASILVLLACQQLFRRRRLDGVAAAPGLAAVLTHYSVVFIPLFLAMTLRRWSSLAVRAAAGGCLLAVGLLIALSQGYLAGKFQFYDEFAAPSRWSGLSSVAEILVMVYAVHRSGLSAPLRRRLVGVTLACTVVFLGMVQLSYAGLRFLDLVTFAFPVAVLYAHSLELVRFNLAMRWLMLALGLLAAAFTFRNFLNEIPLSHASPFLPYRLIF